jgi:hypothetical protein
LAASSMLRCVSNAATAISFFLPNFVPWPFIFWRNLTQRAPTCAHHRLTFAGVDFGTPVRHALVERRPLGLCWQHRKRIARCARSSEANQASGNREFCLRHSPWPDCLRHGPLITAISRL